MSAEVVERQGPRAVSRALSLLSALGAFGASASVSDLMTALGYPISTTYRLLQALVEADFATQDPVTKRYTLGPAALRLAEQASDRGGLRTVARPILERLRDQTRETVFLARLVGDEIEYIDVLTSEHPVRMVGEIGSRGPVYATAMGKCILAFLDDETRDQIVDRLDLKPLTRLTITDKTALRAEIATVCSQGYALNDQQRELGARSVGAPVLDLIGRPLAAIAVGAPSYRVRVSSLTKEVAPLVIAAATEITNRLVETGSLLVGKDPFRSSPSRNRSN
jgi:DNA-binding IclR family transcriptional regulator